MSLGVAASPTALLMTVYGPGSAAFQSRAATPLEKSVAVPTIWPALLIAVAMPSMSMPAGTSSGCAPSASQSTATRTKSAFW